MSPLEFCQYCYGFARLVITFTPWKLFHCENSNNKHLAALSTVGSIMINGNSHLLGQHLMQFFQTTEQVASKSTTYIVFWMVNICNKSNFYCKTFKGGKFHKQTRIIQIFDMFLASSIVKGFQVIRQVFNHVCDG